MIRDWIRQCFLICGLVVLVTGCSHQENVSNQMFLLPVNPLPPVAQQTAPLLVVKTELADYLNQPGLVYRTSQTQVIQARHNQWAQRISDQITSRIIQDLRSKQTRYWPEAMSNDPLTGKPLRLIVRIQKFNGVYTGEAEIAGEWTLLNPTGQRIRNHYFDLHIALKESGYAALVSALSEGVGQFTDSLSSQL
ncbi:hypothetical protein VA7868_00888 [Vibrio aerogenes CECT 7868]|uniref:ABC-type transport auxiliary lipoprotein component domain-containing protein n=1 Tax=Vibrio aerogenes CECT 7868 TaxID=1216006 RepID=A0A1M5WXH5_9VIBR|nr:ABC-type transport auxiliary lipoprotein family protein [Vibrio aerogenes]SHH91583.1 hypothetical protein VA7868_00888 [Vibrio aerogenes CECT 7868]